MIKICLPSATNICQQGYRFENTKRRHRGLKRRQMAANNYEKGGKKGGIKNSPNKSSKITL